MNPITLPTSPETRAALEKAGWYLADHRLTRIERWCHDDPNADIVLRDTSIVPGIGNGSNFFMVLEFGTILHMTPVEQRKAVAYGELRDCIMDAASDLDAAFVLLENHNHTDAKRHLSAAIGRLMLGGKRESVAVPMDLARRYREAWYNPDQRQAKVEREELERALAVLFRSAVLTSEQHAEQDQAPLPPRPSEEGGPSPVEMAEPTDEQLRMYSEIISREPGFHQVNPINQRKAAALHPDGQALLNMVQTGLDSYDTPRITRELQEFFADGEADEPQEEETP